MARPSKQEVDDIRKKAALEAAYNDAMTTTEAAPARPMRPASAPMPPMAPKRFAKGGSVSASRRADGCATKGKTRGKFI
jgi:hypothetical protein